MTTPPDPSTTLPMTYEDAVKSLARELVQRLSDSSGQRYMLGVAGGPGSGKSTFTDSLCDQLNALLNSEMAVVVPMDGFHKTNAELHALGMWQQKGEPETFNSADFVGLLSRIRNFPNQASTAPRFDRTTDEPVPDAISISPSHTVVIVEGNYLLLPTAPWTEIPGILDDVWYLETPEDVVIQRLETRHQLRGLTGDAMTQKIATSDLKNARRIADCKHYASRILSLPLQQG